MLRGRAEESLDRVDELLSSFHDRCGIFRINIGRGIVVGGLSCSVGIQEIAVQLRVKSAAFCKSLAERAVYRPMRGELHALFEENGLSSIEHCVVRSGHCNLDMRGV